MTIIQIQSYQENVCYYLQPSRSRVSFTKQKCKVAAHLVHARASCMLAQVSTAVMRAYRKMHFPLVLKRCTGSSVFPFLFFSSLRGRLSRYLQYTHSLDDFESEVEGPAHHLLLHLVFHLFLFSYQQTIIQSVPLVC